MPASLSLHCIFCPDYVVHWYPSVGATPRHVVSKSMKLDTLWSLFYRTAMAPFLANVTLGQIKYKWMIYGEWLHLIHTI